MAAFQSGGDDDASDGEQQGPLLGDGAAEDAPQDFLLTGRISVHFID